MINRTADFASPKNKTKNKSFTIKMAILFFLALLPFAYFLHAKQELNPLEKKVAAYARKAGFSDIEIDNIHGAIQRDIHQLYKMMLQDKEATKKVDLGLQKCSKPRLVENFSMFSDEKYVEKMDPDCANIKISHDLERFVKKVSGIKGNISESKSVYSIDLGLGTYFSSPGSIFLYRTRVHFFSNTEHDKLTGIIFQFDRTNASGKGFVAERRLLINPSPEDIAKTYEKGLEAMKQAGNIENNGTDKPKDNKTDNKSKLNDDDLKLDRHDDLTSEYYEYGENEANFPLEPMFVEILNEKTLPMPYRKQLEFKEGYKSYLRRAARELKQVIYDFDLKRRTRISKIIDFNK